MNKEKDACTPPNGPPPLNGLAAPVPVPAPAVAPGFPPPPNALPPVPKMPPVVPEVVPPTPGVFPAPALGPAPPKTELLVVFAPRFANGLAPEAGAAPGVDEV